MLVITIMFELFLCCTHYFSMCMQQKTKLKQNQCLIQPYHGFSQHAVASFEMNPRKNKKKAKSGRKDQLLKLLCLYPPLICHQHIQDLPISYIMYSIYKMVNHFQEATEQTTHSPASNWESFRMIANFIKSKGFVI